MASAVILAGGHARRFGGRDKGALVVGGRSILDRQIDELARITDDILLVGRGDHAFVPDGVRAVPDRVTDCGPLGGLDAALAAARDETLVVLGCDMPCVTAPFMSHLLELADTADAVVPRTERGYHPLCAAYTRACHAPVIRRLKAGQLTMLGLLGDVRVRVVERDEIEQFGDRRQILANVNTPDDLDGLEALLDHKR